MNTNYSILSEKYSLLSTENTILKKYDEDKQTKLNPWSSTLSLSKESKPVSSFNLNHRLKSNNIGTDIKILAQKQLQRPSKRSLENFYLKKTYPVKQLHLEPNSKLISVKNTLLENAASRNQILTISAKPIQTTDVDFDHSIATLLPINSKELPTYQFDPLLEIKLKDEDAFFGEVDIDLYEATKKLNETRTAIKVEFLSAVCTSLVNLPNFKSYDQTVDNLSELAEKIEKFDPEFLLKVALYARQDLNIRSTSNFLLAYAANSKKCRIFLRKYFQKTIRLPSDWLEVATIYQNVEGKEIKRDSLPSMLRKVMVEKFEDFDEYQLAKYNKRKRKKKSNSDESKNNDKEIFSDDEDKIEEKHVFTLKRMIRLLHISKPNEPVMGLLGKNYPDDPEKFRQSGLLGVWDPEKAGKRMKLKVPVTWETQLSEKGNKAEVWQKLIDERKLPYMAMLRNIRNIILTKVSNEHHSLVLKQISSKNAVINSRQFPLSFYNAYETLKDLEKLLDKAINNKLDFKKKRGEENAEAMRRRIVLRKMKKKCDNADKDIIPLYKKSLEKAIQISVEYNLDPIPGRTLVICDLHSCTSKDTNSKLVKQNLLLGLMCLSACEDCNLKVSSHSFDGYIDVKPSEDSILDTVHQISSLFGNIEYTRDDLDKFVAEHQVPMLESYLEVQAMNQQSINTLVYFTLSSQKSDGHNENLEFATKYRLLCNPNLLYVCVYLCPPKNSRFYMDGPLNIQFGGTSDQVLKFLATHGNSSQLEYVERIDGHFNLKPLPKGLAKHESDLEESSELKLPPIKPPLEWKTVRIFISSTFKDMHGERDLLVRYVFPELRARAKNLLLNVHEVDLRWGITEEESNQQRSSELCLTEVGRCHFFLGILGERYGTVPRLTTLPDEPQFDWVREYPSGASLTELEIFSAALSNPEDSRSKAFFYFRDNSFESELPFKWRQDFASEDETSSKKISNLKNRIKNGGFEVYNDYPCSWGKEINNVPVLIGLESFGQRVLDNLWNAVKKLSENSEELNEDIIDELPRQTEVFVKRENTYDKCMEAIEKPGNLIVVYGKPRSGKTSFLLDLAHQILEKDTCLSCFIGQQNNMSNLSDILLNLCHSACTKLSLAIPIPKDKLNLETVFWDVMIRASKRSPTGRLIIILDGVEQLSNEEDKKLFWLPQNIDPAIRIVLSVNEAGSSHKTLQERLKMGQLLSFLPIDALPVARRKTIVTQTLESHRKTLSNDAFNNQMLLLVTKRDASLPSYLKLACEQLRLFGNFDELTTKIKSLPQSLGQLLKEILNNLEQFHGHSLVEATLTLLALSKEGLEEHELQTLISFYLKFNHTEMEVYDLLERLTDMQSYTISPSILASLCRSFRNVFDICNSTSSRLSINDSQILAAIKSRFLGIGTQKKAVFTHKLLAAYFISISDPNRDETWKALSNRALRSVCYHLQAANNHLVFTKVLCSMNFISVAFRLGEVQIILDAIGNTLNTEAAVSKYDKQKKVKIADDLGPLRNYYDFITSCLHMKISSPKDLIQQALCEPDSSIVYQNAKIESRNIDSYFFELLSKSKESSSCKMMLNDFPIDILCCATNDSVIALGGSDGVVRIVSAQTGKVIRSLIGHGEGISCLAFVNHNTICCGSYDNSLSVWDVDRGFRICILKGHNRRVTACSVDSNGKTIISVSWDGTIRVWSGQDGGQISSLENKKPLTTVATHPHKDIIVTGDFEKTLKLWDLEKLKRILVLSGHTSSIQCVSFSRDGLNIVSGSLLGEIFVWGTLSGTLIAKSPTQTSSITRFQCNGSLISAEWNGSIKVWNDLDETTLVSKDVSRKDGTIAVLHFLNQDQIALGFSNGSVIIYKFPEMNEIQNQNLGSSVTKIASYFNIIVIAGTETGLVKFVYGDNGQLVNYKLNDSVTSLACSLTLVLAGSNSGQIFTISVKDGTLLTKTQAHDGPVLSLCLTNGGIILTVGSDKKFRVYKSYRKEIMLRNINTVEEAHADWITCVTIGNKIYATGSLDTTVKLWNSSNLELQHSLVGLGEPVSSVKLIDEFVLASGVKGNLTLWNTKGQLIYRASSESSKIRKYLVFHVAKESIDNLPLKGNIAFIPNEQTLQINKLFEISIKSELNGHKGPVTGLALLDNNLIVSSSSDKSLRWWDYSISPQKYHSGKLIALEISKKGYFVLSADVYSLNIWRLNFKETLLLELVTRINYSKACITAATFVNHDGTSLICATNAIEEEKKVYGAEVYNLIGNELKKISQVKDFKSEVTWIDWMPHSDVVTLSFKNGDLGHTDSYLNGINLFPSNLQTSSTTWIMSVKKMDRDHTYFVVELGDGRGWLYSHNYADAVSNTNRQSIFYSWDEYDNITTYCVTGDEIIVGDSKGGVQRWKINYSYFERKDSSDNSSISSSSSSKSEDLQGETYLKQAIHSNSVTGICVCKNVIFTSSLDQTIKVWNSEPFKQVGQFTYNSPITKLAACEKGDKVQLFFSTNSVEINLLQWSKNKVKTNYEYK